MLKTLDVDIEGRRRAEQYLEAPDGKKSSYFLSIDQFKLIGMAHVIDLLFGVHLR